MERNSALCGRLRVVLDRHGVWIDELIALLEQVTRDGSINRAAKATGIGYRRSWQVLHDAARLFSIPLVASKTGGHAGGGSVATAEATRLLAELNRIQTELNRELSRLVEDTRERGSDHALPAESAESAGAALPRSADLLLASSMEPVESGLLAVLERSFEEESGIHARHVATGSGEALSMVVAGRADLAVSHAPRAELGLLERGKLRDRAPLMTSRFVPACGPADPLGLRSRREPQRLDSLFAEIAAAEVPFVTRGDGSGTHLRELEIWERLGIDPSRQSWYHRAESQGSVGALHTAEALGGYTLVDALVMRAAGAPCVETADHELARNLYSVVGRGGSGGRGAEEFLTWIRSGHARDICERFGLVPAE